MWRRVGVLLFLGLLGGLAWWLSRPVAEDLPGPALSRNLPVQVDGIALGMAADDLEPVAPGTKGGPLVVRVTPDPDVVAFLEQDRGKKDRPGRAALVRVGPAGVESVIGHTLAQAGRRMLSAGDTRSRCVDRLRDMSPRAARGSSDLVAPVRGGYVYLGFREGRLLTVYVARDELNMLYQGASPVPLP